MVEMKKKYTRCVGSVYGAGHLRLDAEICPRRPLRKGVDR